MRYVARRGWSQRLYPIAEFLTFLGGILLILFIFFFATWSPR